MPDPSIISLSQVNEEMNGTDSTVSSTATISLSNNWVKNVASDFYTGGSINFGSLRWGVNFPGRYITIGPLSVQVTNTALYRSTPLISLVSYAYATVACTANVTFQINSNGVLYYDCTRSTGSDIRFHRTWLTSGVASDYTVNFVVESGTVTGSATNTDLALSTTRTWAIGSSAAGAGYRIDEDLASGNLIIKSGGTEIFRRPWAFSTTAEKDF